MIPSCLELLKNQWLLQDKVYSGSHNTIEIWDAVGKFNLKGKIDHKFGSVHSLAVNSQYVFAGTYSTCQRRTICVEFKMSIYLPVW